MDKLEALRQATNAWLTDNNLDAESTWIMSWLRPKCVLLEYARSVQGRIPEDVAEKLVVPLLGDKVAERVRRHYDRLLKSPEGGMQAALLIHGLVEGVLAARSWALLRQGGSASLAEQFDRRALACLSAYQDAWPLCAMPWGVEGGRKNAFVPAGPTEQLDQAISRLQGQALPDGRPIAVGGILTLQRLLQFILDKPASGAQGHEPLFFTRVSMLLYNEHYSRGEVHELAVSNEQAGVLGFYLDPVAMGLTIIDGDMQRSLAAAWRLCEDALMLQTDRARSRPVAIRLAPQLTRVAQLSGGSAGTLLACGMYAAAKQTPLNIDATATAMLQDDAAGTLKGVDSIKEKLVAAKAARLRHVVLENGQADEHRSYGERLGLTVHGAWTIAEALEKLTGDARIERVLAQYCRQRVEEWERARQDPKNCDKLMHYVEPHYSWLKDPISELADASSRPARRVPSDEARESMYGPVAHSEDGAETELEKLFLGDRLICITEDAGAGKTIFTRRLEAFLCSKAAQRTLFDGRPQLVVRFEKRVRAWPRDFQAGLVESLAAALEDACREEAVDRSPAEVAQWALKHNRVVLILDALDQVQDQDRIDSLQEFLTTGWGRECSVVLTSRAFAVNERKKTMFHHVPWRLGRIEGFDVEQQHQYLTGIVPAGPPEELQADLDRRTAAYRQSLATVFPQYDDVAELVRVPVVLSLVRELAERGDLQPFRTRGELYLQVDEELMRRAAEKLGQEHDRRARHRWRQIVAAAAFEMMRRGNWDYAVLGDAAVVELQDAAGARCRSPVTDAEWRQIEQVTGFADRCILEEASRQQFGFKHRGMMEFYSGLHLACNDQPGWVVPEANSQRKIVPIRCGDPHMAIITNDENWHWAWRFAAELPGAVVDERSDNGVFNPAVLAASLAELYRPPETGRRPTELMYRAWHRFEVDERLLRQFQWVDEWGEPLEGDALVERGRKLLLPGAAAVIEEFRRPLQELLAPCDEARLDATQRRRRAAARELMDSFVRCPPNGSSPDACTFWMGSPDEERRSYDCPRHRVTVAPFLLMKTAVTCEQFTLFEAPYESWLQKNSRDKPDPRGPAIWVDWYDAYVFCKWLGEKYGLPTEAEWEFAARAGSGGTYCRIRDPRADTGYCDLETEDELHLAANFGQDLSDGKTIVVDSAELVPNSWGLHQMHGNVWEWCWDWYDRYWYKERTMDGNPEIAILADCGPTAGVSRVLRGGGWDSDADGCRSAYRRDREPNFIYSPIGFRVSRVCPIHREL